MIFRLELGPGPRSLISYGSVIKHCFRGTRAGIQLFKMTIRSRWIIFVFFFRYRGMMFVSLLQLLRKAVGIMRSEGSCMYLCANCLLLVLLGVARFLND